MRRKGRIYRFLIRIRLYLWSPPPMHPSGIFYPQKLLGSPIEEMKASPPDEKIIILEDN